jgi:hypothetical protein
MTGSGLREALIARRVLRDAAGKTKLLTARRINHHLPVRAISLPGPVSGIDA